MAVLSQALERFLLDGEPDLLERYGATASERIRRAQHLSWWMTSTLHRDASATDFDARRRLGELDMVTGSAAGRTFLAEAYTGWPIALTNPASVAAEALRLTAGRTP